MRLTIFWRILLTQIALLTSIVMLNCYTLSKPNQLTSLSAAILASDAAYIDEAKHLLRIFLAQMRNTEKYVLLQDKAFYNQFIEAIKDFESSVEKMATLIDSRQEQALLEQIRTSHAQYASSLPPALLHKAAVHKDRSEIRDGITARVDELMRFREEAITQKTASARDQAAVAADVVTWLTF